MQSIKENISSYIHKHAFLSGLFVLIFTFFFFSMSLVVANGETVGPSDNHVVSLYLNGEETSVPTRAQTVGDFIESSGLELGENDLVTPSSDTPILEDNFKIEVSNAKPVTIVDSQTKTSILSPYTDPREIAQNAGIVVYPEDKVSLEVTTQLLANQNIGPLVMIDRATPITVSLYGAPAVTYRTHALTVGEFIKENNIVLESGATLLPDASTAISPNLAIFLSKFGKQVVSEEKEIPFEIQSTNDPNKPVGQVTVTTPGKKGKKQVTYELDLRDGKEIGRRVIQEVIIETPSTQIQTKGTKFTTVSGDRVDWMRAAGIDESQFGAVDFIIGRESGWRPGALNAGGCAGLGQACPGAKLVRACPDWQTNPVCQLQFFSGYANGRYGSWQGAYNFWIANRWW